MWKIHVFLNYIYLSKSFCRILGSQIEDVELSFQGSSHQFIHGNGFAIELSVAYLLVNSYNLYIMLSVTRNTIYWVCILYKVLNVKQSNKNVLLNWILMFLQTLIKLYSYFHNH